MLVDGISALSQINKIQSFTLPPKDNVCKVRTILEPFWYKADSGTVLEVGPNFHLSVSNGCSSVKRFQAGPTSVR